WLYLAGAIVLEIAGTTSMKLSDGLTKLVPSILIFVFYGLSFLVFTMAIKKIDLSVAYAIWAGTGTALIALIGITHFKEPLTLIKIVSLGLIIIGVVGLNISGPKN
ncbi:MAG: multidrug efflux SMR transporter, partial [Gammaproteobacteria bacterium]|nr:multidrug efflux SMR transporter [Gammaproteobacteria bacterium]